MGKVIFLQPALLIVLTSLAITWEVRSIAAETVSVRVANESAQPLNFGAGYLKKTLKNTGHATTHLKSDRASIHMVVGDLSTVHGRRLGKGLDVPTSANSFVINVRDTTVRVIGRDAVGAMYGCFELADAIELIGGGLLLDAIVSKTASPFLQIRADNFFIRTKSDGQLPNEFHNEAFWTNYISMLARNRFNTLNLNARDEFSSTTSPNVLSLFVVNSKFPGENHDTAIVDRNTSMLKKIVQVATGYGVKVVLKNDTSRLAVAQDQQQNYVSDCVNIIKKRIPNLTIIKCGQSKNITGTEPVRVEVSYNNGRFGLPYLIPERISADYFKAISKQQPFTLTWRLPGLGSHGVFRWGNPKFVRRTIQSCTLGGSDGFTLDPITTYYTQDPNHYFQELGEADFITWMFERHWWWYRLWGLLGYDPETPADMLFMEFQRRFGPEAAPHIHDLLVATSKIAPLINAYPIPRFNGIHVGSNIVTPLDSRVTIPIHQFIDSRMKKITDGRLGPFETMDRLGNYARQIHDMLNHVPPIVEHGRKEWVDMRKDLNALKWLAAYYSYRIQGRTDLYIYMKTKNLEFLRLAELSIEEAYNALEMFTRIAGSKYPPDPNFPKASRINQPTEIQRELVIVKSLSKSMNEGNSASAPNVTITSFSDEAKGLARNVRLTFTAEAQDTAKITGFQLLLDGKPTHRENRISINPPESTYETTMELANLKWQVGRNFLTVRVFDDQGRNGTITHTVVRAGKRDALIALGRKRISERSIAPPFFQQGWRIHSAQPKPPFQTGSLQLTATTGDPTVVRMILHHKPLANQKPWRQIDMLRETRENWSATVPLTDAGLLYSFESHDAHGNTRMEPNFERETPYFMIPAW